MKKDVKPSKVIFFDPDNVPSRFTCACGEKKIVCRLCGQLYCPKCDQYHREGCEDAYKP